MLRLKWYQLLIIGALVGSGITIGIFYLWLKPKPDTEYQVKYAVEKANNVLLEKQLGEKLVWIDSLQERLKQDSINAFKSLENLSGIKPIYVKVHDSIRHLDVDGDIHFLRSRLPAKNPY